DDGCRSSGLLSGSSAKVSRLTGQLDKPSLSYSYARGDPFLLSRCRLGNWLCETVLLTAAYQGHHDPQKPASDGHNGFFLTASLAELFESGTPVANVRSE